MAPYPKIELHVHLEGTVRPHTLLEIARRNDYPLPADTVEGLAELYAFRDFRHFIEVWILTTNALQTAEDFRQMVVDYAGEARAHGAVYFEGIFSPAERVRRGCSWEAVYEGVCAGAQEARELLLAEHALNGAVAFLEVDQQIGIDQDGHGSPGGPALARTWRRSSPKSASGLGAVASSSRKRAADIRRV